jgi:aminoglycoside 6-adenylyltransferase
MRSEKEMLDLILDTAREDERIRAVVMNGSRANPRAPRDIFQDFDIVYFVSELESFLADHSWVDRFGERVIMQLPDLMADPPPANGFSFAYLMQFADGNRIDLTLYPVAELGRLANDSLTVILLDKDSLFPDVPPPSDSDYLPKPPTAKAYADCCNEFWWVSPYVAKGLWREELPYAKHMLEVYVRDQLDKMLVWQIGIATDFSTSPGKLGKYFERCLDPDLWSMYERTYSDAGYESAWEALFAMGKLFRLAAAKVARGSGFEYPRGDDERVSAYLRKIRALPRGATEI